MNQNELLSGLAQALAPFMGGGALGKADGTPVTTYAYSEGGLFGSCKNDPVLINALVGPMGYEAKLQFVGTSTENPIVESLTRIVSTGYDQASSCADCGTPRIYRCSQTACFGRICQATEEVLFDELGLKANNNVQQLALYGSITDPAGNVLVGQGQAITDMLTMYALAAAYNLRRRLGQLWWAGNPASNAGGYSEFPGFDLLINTGMQDALTGLACNALDSIVDTYANNVVGAAGSPSIVASVAAIVRSIKYRMDMAGFGSDGAQIDIVMHPTLWDCVADAWACEYGLSCQSTSTSISMQNDALAVADLRDQFVNGRYLRIDGQNYPVTLDNGIAVTNRPYGTETARCSTIYVITRVIPGAPPVPDSPGGGVVVYGEYQDLNATGGAAIRQFGGMFNHLQVTDGGRYVVAAQESGGYCVDLKILSKPRLRMLMPWTSGRLTNVCCVPVGTYPDVSGSGGVYEVDGGATTSPPNYLYGDCWPTHVGGAGRPIQ
jgi:hypothetical protein